MNQWPYLKIPTTFISLQLTWEELSRNKWMVSIWFIRNNRWIRMIDKIKIKSIYLRKCATFSIKLKFRLEQSNTFIFIPEGKKSYRYSKYIKVFFFLLPCGKILWILSEKSKQIWIMCELPPLTLAPLNWKKTPTFLSFASTLFALRRISSNIHNSNSNLSFNSYTSWVQTLAKRRGYDWFEIKEYDVIEFRWDQTERESQTNCLGFVVPKKLKLQPTAYVQCSLDMKSIFFACKSQKWTPRRLS